MRWISAQDLERWANETTASRADVAELVGDLIRASATETAYYRFPKRDSAQLPGFDGRLNARGLPPYVPDGDSIWEFGTEKDYLDKVNRDYASRTGDPLGLQKRETTNRPSDPSTLETQ